MKEILRDSYGDLQFWVILAVILIPIITPIIVLIYLDYTSTLNLINSFNCDDFKKYLQNAEHDMFWVNNLYVERCK